MNIKSKNSIRHQTGSVLIVSLILLLLITILGLSNIRTVTMEMRMSNSARDRSQTFQAVESVLRAVESDLSTNSPLIGDVYSTCTGSTECFNLTCENNGLCFDGAFDIGDILYSTEYDCTIAPGANLVERTEFWSDTALDVWNTPARHSTQTVSGITVKYIKEFLCFAAPVGVTFDPSTANDGEPLFRITAYGEGEGGAKVMLQSTSLLNGAFGL